MTFTEDANKEMTHENRGPSTAVVDRAARERWCMYMPEDGFTAFTSQMTIQVRDKQIPPLTFVKMDRQGWESLQSGCVMARCVLIKLPPGISPADLKTKGK